MKVEWTRDNLGALVSRCGRFCIRADYMGTTRAQGYTLLDTKARESSHDTQRQAKNYAQQLVDREGA